MVVAGFHEHASGLVVPDAVARAREVWTKDELKLLLRALRLMNSRQVRVAFICEACKQPLQHEKMAEGTPRLRCACKDREFTRRF